MPPRRWLAPEFFTDEKMKKAAPLERLLAAAIIANQDDDGRLRGDPAYLRSIAFLYDDYSLDQVKEMLNHLVLVNPNIILYNNSGDDYIQLKRYSRYQKPRYYHPSKLPPPPGWPFPEDSNQGVTTEKPSSNHVVTAGKGKGKDLNKDLNKGKGEGEGRKTPHPSPSDCCTDRNKISTELIENFRMQWGKVEAKNPDKIIPREPGGKDLAQLRDLSAELVAAGGCPLGYIREAFREAAGQGKNKEKISYVRAILCDWLGIKRNRSP